MKKKLLTPNIIAVPSFRKNPIYIAHKKLGFPPIDEKQQYELLLNANDSVIYALTPEFSNTPIPLELFKHYITIKKGELKNYILNNGYIQKIMEGIYAAHFITYQNNEFKIQFNERGAVYDRQILKSPDAMATWLANYLFTNYKLM